MEADGQRIAVVGCGVAGLTAAWLLSRRHKVTLFEKNHYFGGHTRTLEIPEGPDAGIPVDTGFIVMNHRNYPLFTKLLERLRVPLEDSSMTFSYTDPEARYSYSGNSLRRLLPREHWLRTSHWALVRDLWRFAKVGYRDLQEGRLNGRCLGDYLDERGFSEAFLQCYFYPMGAAIWSSPIGSMREFPAEPYLHFLENHGLLRLTNRPQWRFVPGGSRTYVRAILSDLEVTEPPGETPQSIRREGGGVVLDFGAKRRRFDHVVIGCHADEALALLADADPREQQNLGPWRYQRNEVILHTDTRFLPPRQSDWASWNFLRAPGSGESRAVSVSYYMNRLQRLETRADYIVTLNPFQPVDPAKVIDRTYMTHPLYSFESMATQTPIDAENGSRNTWFCGSYLGYGFHEDAVRSAVRIAAKFGISL